MIVTCPHCRAERAAIRNRQRSAIREERVALARDISARRVRLDPRFIGVVIHQAITANA